MHSLVHPVDIDWNYISKKGTSSILTRILINILVVFILIFITTPASIINLGSFNPQVEEFLSLNWVKENGVFVKFIIDSLLPAILISLTNEILMYLINISVDKERHYRFTKHQRSQLRKIFIYLFLNIIIVPGFAAVAFTNLF